MKAIRLRTEYLKDPLGIDIQNPLLFWNCEGGKKQASYRIVATSDGKTVWDSGKVASSSMRAEYPEKLVSRQRVEWTEKGSGLNLPSSRWGFLLPPIGKPSGSREITG